MHQSWLQAWIPMSSCHLQSRGESSTKDRIRDSIEEHRHSKACQIVIKVCGFVIAFKLWNFEVLGKQCLHNLVVKWWLITEPIIQYQKKIVNRLVHWSSSLSFTLSQGLDLPELLTTTGIVIWYRIMFWPGALRVLCPKSLTFRMAMMITGGPHKILRRGL